MATKHKNDDYDLYGDLEKIKSAIAEATRDVKGKTNQLMSQSIENVKERSSDIQENVANYVAEKPFKSLGIAMLTGVILGYIFHKQK